MNNSSLSQTSETNQRSLYWKKPTKRRKFRKITKHERMLRRRRVRRLEAEKAQQKKLNSAIDIEEDQSLPTATCIYGKNAARYVNQRVEIRGYLTSDPHKMGSRLWFLKLRDDVQSEAMQCVLEGDLCRTKIAIRMNNRSTLTMRGIIVEYKPNTFELKVDYYEICDPSYFIIKPLPFTMSWEQKSEYLIHGYLRMTQCVAALPLDIKQMVQLYVGDIWNDEWDLNTKNKYIDIQGQNVKTTAPYGTMSLNTAFGSKIIYRWPWCQKYKWKLEMIHSNEFGNRHCFFGVIPAQKVSNEMRNWFVSTSNGGYGYCHRNGQKYHNAVCDFGFSDHYGPALNDGDIIEFELDLEHRTLRYFVNGVGLGIAWDDLMVDTDYRLAVTMGWDGEEVKLLKS